MKSLATRSLISRGHHKAVLTSNLLCVGDENLQNMTFETILLKFPEDHLCDNLVFDPSDNYCHLLHFCVSTWNKKNILGLHFASLASLGRGRSKWNHRSQQSLLDVDILIFYLWSGKTNVKILKISFNKVNIWAWEGGRNPELGY